MANICAICGKTKGTGMQVSHSHIRNKKVWAPNLQNVKIILNGAPRKLKVCTRCLRSGKVQRAI